MCAIVNTIKATGCITVKIIENKKNKKSKFLNPSLTGNLLTESSQSWLSISLIPINLPGAGPNIPPPFLYWSINEDTV